MYAVLGEIEFDLVTYFDGMETRFGSDYAEHALIGRKPRLQFVGDKLDEVKIELVFHVSYCDPEAELVRLRNAQLAHDVLALVLGNGDYKGRFVMTELSSVSKHTDKEGNLLAVEAQMSLREFTGDPAAPIPPAVRTVGSAAPLPARSSSTVKPPASKVERPAAPSPGALARTLATAKSTLSTAKASMTAMKGLRSLAGASPAVAAQRLPGVLAAVNKALPGLGASATAMQRFTQMSATASDAGRLGAGLSGVRGHMSGIPGLGASATAGNVQSKLSAIDALTDRALNEMADIQKPLARLSATAATRAG